MHLDGLYKPGDRLPEAELAAKFNLSRSPGRLDNKRLEQSAKPIVTGRQNTPFALAKRTEHRG